MIELAEECHVDTSTYNDYLLNLINNYSVNNQPIEVSFRDIVPKLKADRVTHLIHSYPAKLLMHIPHFFLNNDIFSKKGDTVLDPFAGSGTVMLEAILAGRNVIGADANPLARLISSVKVHKYNHERLKDAASHLFNRINFSQEEVNPIVPNIDYWFSKEIQNQLRKILYCINEIKEQKIRDFFSVCFSNCIKKVSFADQRVSVPVRLNPDRYPVTHPLYFESKKKLDNLINVNVVTKFREIVDDNIIRFKSLNAGLFFPCEAEIASNDARCLNGDGTDKARSISDSSISLIITSPPYAGAQKYIRASSLNLGWLNLIKNLSTLSELDSLNIGRENYKKTDYITFKKTGIEAADILLQQIYKVNPLRAHIAGNYLKEMRAAFSEATRVLKPGGYLVLVVGNNQVCGMEFETQKYLRQILEGLGLTIVLRLIDDIQSYGLMTKRNKTANVITREWVLVFKK
jgi:DNA modification methylase